MPPTTAKVTLPPAAAELYPSLADYVEQILPKIDAIPQDRKQSLQRLAEFVREKREAGDAARLLFICTHNSRRSHMGQLWSATAAAYFGIDGVETFSGGTEATAFNPRAVAALERAGFAIDKSDESDNPRYRVTFMNDGAVNEAWSKKYGDDANPQENFAAIMTCTAADKACPFVSGSELRVALPYEDPKVADGTPEETAKYDERATQIATEMFYLFAKAANPKTRA